MTVETRHLSAQRRASQRRCDREVLTRGCSSCRKQDRINELARRNVAVHAVGLATLPCRCSRGVSRPNRTERLRLVAGKSCRE